MLSPIHQNYVPIADDSQEVNLQTYMDGYDIAAPGAMIPQMDGSNAILSNSGEYYQSSMHNEGGSMNMMMSAGSGGGQI